MLYVSFVFRRKKYFSDPFDSFWCCVGTGLENHARYGEFIYFTNRKNDLFVNLFIPSVLNWKDRDMKVIQQTNYPESDTIHYTMEMKHSRNFAFNLRLPAWVEKGYQVFVNGEEIPQNATPGSYVSLKRKWKDGDKITYIVPKSIRQEAILGDDAMQAYLYGPLVLAALMPEEQENPPVIVGNNKIKAETQPNGLLVFYPDAMLPANLEMIPYYRTVDKKTAVYFLHYTNEEWEVKKEEILREQDKENWLKNNTVSQFSPGEMQPERDHDFDGRNYELGELQGRKFRKAIDGGWISYSMKVLPDQPQILVCTYWGDLGDIYKFNVYVDGQQVGSTEIIHWWGHKFVDRTYKLPPELTRGKDKVTVKLQALDEKSVAGPLFDSRILK